MPQSKQADLLSQLEGILSQFQDQAQAGGPAPGNWSGRKRGAPGEVLGVAIPLKVNTPSGKVRVYLSLPPEVATSEDSLVDAIEGLLDAGFPVDVWRDNGDRGGWRGRDERGYSRGRRYR